MPIALFLPSLKPDIPRAVVWGLAAFAVSSIVFLLVLATFVDIDSLPSTGKNSVAIGEFIAEFFGSAIVAPALETLILLYIVRQFTASRLPRAAVVVIVAALVTALHAPFKLDVRFLATIFFLFVLFALYLHQRLQIATPRVCWVEGFVMHATHNALAMALTFLE